MRLAVIGIALACACTSTPREQPDPWRVVGSGSDACVTDADAREMWTPVLASIDVTHATHGESAVLVEDLCWKRVYTYGPNRLAAYRDPIGHVEIASRPQRREDRACLVAAMQRATELVPYAHVILDKARAKLGAHWDDVDTGLGKWVDCDDPAAPDPLLHEANHALREHQCLHDPSGPPLCFEGLQTLPPRSLARVASLPLPAGTPRDAYDDWQRIYLDAQGAQSPLILFDELLAYGISAEVEAALVLRHAGERRQIMLPLVAFISVHYWDVLRRDHPDQFATAFAANRAVFARLVARTEAAYDAWALARPPGDREVTAAEDAMWQRYLVAKRALLAR